MDEKKVKGFWDHFKDGFKPVAARADDNLREQREASGGKTQWQIDMGKSRAERAESIKKGFFGK